MSKTQARRVRAAKRGIARRMKAEGLDYNKPEDRLESLRRLRARVCGTDK